jgi:hypothetical protein
MKPPFPFGRADGHRSCFFPNRDLETTRLSGLTSTFPEAPPRQGQTLSKMNLVRSELQLQSELNLTRRAEVARRKAQSGAVFSTAREDCAFLWLEFYFSQA